jgi:hypothetical protein
MVWNAKCPEINIPHFSVFEKSINVPPIIN